MIAWLATSATSLERPRIPILLCYRLWKHTKFSILKNSKINQQKISSFRLNCMMFTKKILLWDNFLDLTIGLLTEFKGLRFINDLFLIAVWPNFFSDSDGNRGTSCFVASKYFNFYMINNFKKTKHLWSVICKIEEIFTIKFWFKTNKSTLGNHTRVPHTTGWSVKHSCVVLVPCKPDLSSVHHTPTWGSGIALKVTKQ